PGKGPWVVGLEAVALGEAYQVEPEEGPAFAVARRGEQTVHEAVIGVSGAVVDEGVHLIGRRRQAGGVEGDAADERDAVRVGGGGEAVRLEFRQDESIDRVAHPGGILDGGPGRSGRGLQGPGFWLGGGRKIVGRRGGAGDQNECGTKNGGPGSTHPTALDR